MMTMMTTRNKYAIVLFALVLNGCFLLGAAADTPQAFAFPALPKTEPAAEAEVRAALQSVFEQLKAGDFNALYEALPSSSRTRISRERFTDALQRTRNLYQLERMEIGEVHAAGNFAAADTVMYAHLTRPFDTEGKLVVQQYLVREDGSWRVATGDRSTIDRFLKTNPGFARRFQIRRPRAFIKQDNHWVEFSLENLRRRK